MRVCSHAWLPALPANSLQEVPPCGIAVTLGSKFTATLLSAAVCHQLPQTNNKGENTAPAGSMCVLGSGWTSLVTDMVGKQWGASPVSQAGSPFLCRAWWNTGAIVDKMDNFPFILWTTKIRLIFFLSCCISVQVNCMCGIWAWTYYMKDICVTAL